MGLLHIVAHYYLSEQCACPSMPTFPKNTVWVGRSLYFGTEPVYFYSILHALTCPIFDHIKYSEQRPALNRATFKEIHQYLHKRADTSLL